MDTTLPPNIERLIYERLQRGPYKNAAEVIEDAFDALKERENYQALRTELDHADDQLARSDYTEYGETNLHELAEDIKTRGMSRLAEEGKSTTR